jgi:hypothetical protein
MATGESNIYDLPYPRVTDPVNVHGDIEALVDKLEAVLPPLGISAFQMPVINNSGEDFIAGTPVYAVGYNESIDKTIIEKVLPSTTKPILGLTRTFIGNGAEGIVIVAGVLDDINTSAFQDGDVLYVGSFGGLTNIRPESGSGAVGIVAHADEFGIIIVEAKGNGTWGALKAGLS